TLFHSYCSWFFCIHWLCPSPHPLALRLCLGRPRVKISTPPVSTPKRKSRKRFIPPRPRTNVFSSSLGPIGAATATPSTTPFTAPKSPPPSRNILWSSTWTSAMARRTSTSPKSTMCPSIAVFLPSPCWIPPANCSSARNTASLRPPAPWPPPTSSHSSISGNPRRPDHLPVFASVCYE